MPLRRPEVLFASSAASMLLGCLAIQQALQLEPGQLRGLLVLLGVLQAYEGLLLALVAVLGRRKLTAAATTLLLLETAFVLDVTFVGAEIATVSPGLGGSLAVLGVGLALAKGRLACWALDLRPGHAVSAVAVTQVAAALALAPTFASVPGPTLVRIAYGAWWLLALLPLADHALRVPAPRTTSGPDALRFGPPAGLVVHLVAASWVQAIDFVSAMLAPVLLGFAARGVLARRELPGAVVVAILLGLGTTEDLRGAFLGVTVTPLRLTLLAAAVVWGLAAWRGRRLAIVSALASLIAAASGPSVTEMTERWERVLEWMPRGVLAWGVIGVAAAFVLLAVGGIAALRGGPPAPPAPEPPRGQSPGRRFAELFAACAVLLLIGVIALPSPHGHRGSANEAANIGWLRTVVAAEQAWASEHEGAYAPLACLAQPSACDSRSKLVFLGPNDVDMERSGYRRAFYGHGDGTRLTTFTLAATPLRPGQSGVRSFAATADGVICWADVRGQEIAGVREGRPVQGCKPLQ